MENRFKGKPQAKVPESYKLIQESYKRWIWKDLVEAMNVTSSDWFWNKLKEKSTGYFVNGCRVRRLKNDYEWLAQLQKDGFVIYRGVETGSCWTRSGCWVESNDSSFIHILYKMPIFHPTIDVVFSIGYVNLELWSRNWFLDYIIISYS